MHEDELWQVYLENGQPIVDRGATDDAFAADPTLVMANAHVWMWKKTNRGIAILLQKRAKTKKTSPGYYHISAAGHINQGETAIEAALRETREELGVDIDPARLYLIHVTRSEYHLTSLLHVYAYELQGDAHFSFDDGEVELVEWYDLETFHAMTEDVESYKLIDQGRSYFAPLIATIQRLALANS
jgi:isopentenyl-diphosphate delta-isomerase